MAAATAAAIGSSAIGAGLSLFQAFQKPPSTNYKRQDLVNNYENVQIPTSGSDLMRENTSRMSANMVDASRNGGMRGVFGAIPRIQAYNDNANAQQRVYLDDKIEKRDYAIAQDNERIQAVKEQRDSQNLMSLSSQAQAKQQNMFSGMMGLGKSLTYGLNNIPFDKEGSAYDQMMKNSRSNNQNNQGGYRFTNELTSNSIF